MIKITFWLFLCLSIQILQINAHKFTVVTDELKKNMDVMDGRVSWMVQLKNGTLLVKEHLSNPNVSPYTDDSTIHIASGCKWPAMTTIMKLVEQGQLSLSTKISDFFKNGEFTQQNADDVTLLQLMTHTHGFQYVDEWCFAVDISLQDSVIGIAKGGTVNGKTLTREELQYTPGTQILYGDIGMQIAGAIAEKVSGKGFNQLFQDVLATPLGMTNARFTPFDGEEGINIAVADGMKIKMTDYANFMLMLMNGGVYNGKQILQKSTVDAILKDYTGNLKVHPTNEKYATDGKLSFGLGNWVINEGNYRSSNGVHHFYNYFDIKNDYLVIFYLRTTLDKNNVLDTVFDNLAGKIESIIKTTDFTETVDISKKSSVLIIKFAFFVCILFFM